MFTFKSFLVILIFCQFVNCSKFLVLRTSGWKGWTKFLTGLGSGSYLLKSTGNKNEFIGNNLKLSHQDQKWIFEDGEKSFYKTSENGDLPLGKNKWESSTNSWPKTGVVSVLNNEFKINITELQCGKNIPGYMITEKSDSFASTAEICLRQVSRNKYIFFIKRKKENYISYNLLFFII